MLWVQVGTQTSQLDVKMVAQRIIVWSARPQRMGTRNNRHIRNWFNCIFVNDLQIPSFCTRGRNQLTLKQSLKLMATPQPGKGCCMFPERAFPCYETMYTRSQSALHVWKKYPTWIKQTTNQELITICKKVLESPRRALYSKTLDAHWIPCCISRGGECGLTGLHLRWWQTQLSGNKARRNFYR